MIENYSATWAEPLKTLEPVEPPPAVVLYYCCELIYMWLNVLCGVLSTNSFDRVKKNTPLQLPLLGLTITVRLTWTAYKCWSMNTSATTWQVWFVGWLVRDWHLNSWSIFFLFQQYWWFLVGRPGRSKLSVPSTGLRRRPRRRNFPSGSLPTCSTTTCWCTMCRKATPHSECAETIQQQRCIVLYCVYIWHTVSSWLKFIQQHACFINKCQGFLSVCLFVFFVFSSALFVCLFIYVLHFTNW